MKSKGHSITGNGRTRRVASLFVLVPVLAAQLLTTGGVHAYAGSRISQLASFDVNLYGLSATVDPLEPTVPKNTASAVRILVRTGDRTLSTPELTEALGGPFEVHAELSGPGLTRAITLPDLGPSDLPPTDPLLLSLPPVPYSGDYRISNIRITRNGSPVLDVAPSSIPLKVIEQVLVTSVTTRPLTLDEIREKGIVLDSDDYVAFEFTLGVATESKSVSFSLPVVFDRQGVPVPQVIEPPGGGGRSGISLPDDTPEPLIVPAMLEAQPPPGVDPVEFQQRVRSSGEPIRIPSVLVIPGNVGYLKQFFSAQLFVANGAPVGSGLTVRDVKGTVKLPAGADLQVGTADDPLALPETVRGTQPTTMAVRGVGLDGAPATADDVDVFRPGEQGQAEFLIRGEKEGFHELSFDIDATLDGLPIGPVAVKGQARGGVLVRNPFFDMTFTVPSVVRAGEPFSLFATVSNIGHGIANDVTVALDASRMSGMTLVGSGSQSIDTLRTGDARTLEYRFVSQRTGQVFATYLNFDTGAPGGGRLNFTLGVGERGIALSPDTLVMPNGTDNLPAGVVAAAMRVIGQAWSISNAPTGTLPPEVIRISRAVTTQKTLALAEAGLRATLGQASSDAVRDLVFDFYGGAAGALDPGFDQLLRETEAGRAFAQAAGGALASAAQTAGSAVGLGRQLDHVAISGPDYVRFAIASGTSAAPVSAVLVDGAGRRCTAGSAVSDTTACTIPGAVWLPLSSASAAPQLGVVTTLGYSGYTLELTGTGSGTLDLSVALPRGGGTFASGERMGVAVSAGTRLRLVADPRRPDALELELDAEGDGTYEQGLPLSMTVLTPSGPELISATVVGPETLDGASPFGFHVAALFDRVVSTQSAGEVDHYSIPQNAVQGASAQLSGRIVFASLAQPEGPYVPTTFAAGGLRDSRGFAGPLRSVSLGCTLEDPGAVVSGRVVGPDGTPLAGGTVTYTNNALWTCPEDMPYESTHAGFSAVQLDAQGRFEFRYVRQDECGLPWGVRTVDPATGALRVVSGFVQIPGESVVVDIALFGQGSVTGTIRDIHNAPVPGAQVVVVSQTDPQVGGVANADGDGKYAVYGITVGPVSVRAAKGAGVGQAAGYIGRAGGSAVVDVTLDSDGAAVAGHVFVEEGSSVRKVPGLNVVFESEGVPVAVAQTDNDGAYSFESVPVGAYRITATLNTRDFVRVSGSLGAGDVLTNQDLVISVPVPGSNPTTGPGYGTVRGSVLFPSGDPAPGVVVAIGNRGVLSGEDGAFEITGVPVQAGVGQSVQARSRDGLRTGSAVAFVNERNQIVSGVTVALSGLGSAQFTVVGPNGVPVPGLTVGLLDRCEADCGCDPKTTDAQGKVRFDGLPIGGATARVVRSGVGFVDVATGSASVTRDGEVAQGTLRLAGAGVVSGVVRDPNGQPILGADVTLYAPVFNSDMCTLGGAVAQRVRTSVNGAYRFQAVNVGGVSVSASQIFYPVAASASGVLTNADQELVLNLVLDNSTTIAGELRGTVFLPDGATPAGAGIEVTATGALPDVVVNTDAQGQYHFAKVFPQGSYTVTARDPISGGLARSSVYLRANEDLVQDVRLLGRGTVLVHVVDAADQPVDDAFVRLRETTFPERVFEGAANATNQGVLRFENVFEGPLSAEASDRFGRGGRASSVLSGPGATLELTVRMSMTGRVTGKFVQPDGVTPIPFGSVTLVAGGRVIGQTTTQGSGSDVGRFAFEHVPAGPVRADAQDPITARTGFALGTITAEGQVVDLTLRANGIGTVEGLVTSNGTPQAGAEVQLTAGPLHANSVSDALGHYRIAGVPEGPVSVSANLGNGFLSGGASATLAGDGTLLTLNVALADSGRVTGHVLRADGTTPAPVSLVALRAGGSSFSTTSDAQGAFAFERVPAGQGSLSADVLGSIDSGSAIVQVTAAEPAVVTIVLNGTGKLGGRALSSTGALTGGTLTVTGTGSLPYSLTTAVGADGLFSFPEVLAGPFTASLSVRTSSGFTLYGSKSGTLHPDEQLSIDVQVQPSGTVGGRVLRANGTTPAFGSEVSLVLSGGRGTFTLYTDSEGRFAAPGIPPGGLDLHVRDPFSSGFAQRLALNMSSNGETLDVGDLVLDDSPVSALSFDPPNGALQVAVNRPIVVTFSDELATPQGLVVSTTTQSVGANASLSADKRTVTLTGGWPDASEITVTATTAVTDLFGRHPVQATSSKFTTVDLSPPHVVSVTPTDGAIEVAASAAVEVRFHEDVDAAMVLQGLVTLSAGGSEVLGSTERIDARRFRFTPSSALAGDTQLTVRVVGARDASGNAQTVAFTSHFATHDTQPPVLVLSQPPSGSWTNVARPPISVSLSDVLSGIDAASGTLAIDGVSVTPARSSSALGYTPVSDLADGTHALHATVADRAANSATLDAELRIDRVAPGPAQLSGLSAGQALTGLVAIAASASDALSGVQRIRVLSDGVQVLELLAPDFTGSLNSAQLSEGAHLLSAHAVDYAGNVGPAGSSIAVVANSQVLSVQFTAPAAGLQVRGSIVVAAIVSEPAQQVTFSIGANSITDTTAPYAATLSLADVPEGDATITATALGLLNESANATRAIFVDLTPPGAPDATRVFAEPPDNGLSLIYGQAGAVEPGAKVQISNSANGATALATAAADGGFATNLTAASGNTVVLVAVDAAGNASAPATTVVRTITSLPPVTATLTFEGLPWDRVRVADLTRDSANDAVFTFSFGLGTGIMRQLAFVDLEGGGTLRSTRLFGSSALGVVKTDLGAPFLNNADGTVDASLSGNVSLLLFAADAGLLQAGATYKATAAFTNGARYVGTVGVAQLPRNETVSAVWSTRNDALPFVPGSVALQPRETVSGVDSVLNQSLPFVPGSVDLQPRETVSGVMSVQNASLPFVPGSVDLQPRETVSGVMSVQNASLPFVPGSADLQPRETVSGVTSVQNQSLPFVPGSGDVQPRETVSVVTSVQNQSLPFVLGSAALLASETVSPTFSVSNDPSAAPTPPPPAAAGAQSTALLASFGASALGASLSAGSDAGAGNGAVLGSAGSAASAGEPGLSIAGVTVSERATEARLRVELSAASTAAVRVDYASARDSATAGSEYQSVWGTLDFAPGITSREIAVTLSDDTLHEPTETFTISLTNASGGSPIVSGQDRATVMLIDDDPVPASGAPWLFDDFESSGDGFVSLGAGDPVRANGLLVALRSGVQSVDRFAVGAGEGAAIGRARVRFSAAGQLFGFNIHGTESGARTGCYFESQLGPSGEVEAVHAVVLVQGSVLSDVSVQVMPNKFVDLAIARSDLTVVFNVDGYEVTRTPLDASEALGVELWNPDDQSPLEADWIEVRPRFGESALCAEPTSLFEYCNP